MFRDVIGKYCIIRTYSAGVHCGIVEDARVEGGVGVVRLSQANRLWRWTEGNEGTLSLSSVSLHGAGDDSKIDGTLEEINLIGAIEIIPCTAEAEKWLRTPRNNK